MIRWVLFSLILLASFETARAVELVVMATNTTAVPGAKVFTVGVQVTQADVANAVTLDGPYVPIPLLVQEVDFVGNILNSTQTNPLNLVQLQAIQSEYIDNAAYNNPVAPGFAAGPPMSLSQAGTHALYASSWWYTGSSGQLMGANDSTGNSGAITTLPAADGSGVYTVGPTNNIGPLGGVWQATPFNNPPTPGMSLTVGLYGGLGTPASNLSSMANLFVGGKLTVPLAQVVTNGNISFDFSTTSEPVGSTQGNNFIVLGTPGTGYSDGIGTFNFLGGNWLVDPHAVLDYSTNSIHSELSSGGGAGIVGGVQVSPAMITGNGNLTSTFTTTALDALGQVIGPGAAQQINFALPGPTVQAWDIQYTGTLQGSSTVVLHYDPTQIGNTPESELRIEHYENGQWVVPAGQVVDTVNHTITFQTDGFSPFVLSQLPEPSTHMLCMLGGLAFVAWRRNGRTKGLPASQS